ncbi:hypothetical protein TrST_g3565 [Triparma strigata]|uniref:Uncharacterized protein n=1 Tax=Triparma strigata TaxID=1606541 RepID=A0A9W7B0L4_9STRA|nr:hypothetical protein TrST_g3565 [Triparma strigata]
MCKVNDKKMAAMALDNIEEVLGIDGRVKVVPWDLVVRESGVKSSKKGGGSDFGVGSYENVRKKFGDNIVDIVSILTHSNLKIEDIITDRGGHPSLEGLRFIINTLAFGGEPTPSPSVSEVVFNRRNFVRGVLMLSHRFVFSILVPLQRRLAVVRPRRKLRGKSIKLLMAARITNVYQVWLGVLTNLSIINEVGIRRWWDSYDYSVWNKTVIFGWDDYDALSPPLLT